MAKYYGMIGFAIQKETRPGVWEEVIHEHPVFGNIDRNMSQYSNGGEVNDSPVLNKQISFVMDTFACEHSKNIKYATYLNAKWKVKLIDVQFPELILTLGDVYND